MAFGLEQDVEVVNGDLSEFMNSHPEVDCIVSPANSFGQMTGGYDQAISDYLGWDFQKKVQAYIKENYHGEQVVGSSFIINTDKDNLKLIHTPTMRVPTIVKDPELVYHCTRSTLLCALNNNVQNIVLPAFCSGCGMVDESTVAILMKKAYMQIKTGHSNEKLL